MIQGKVVRAGLLVGLAGALSVTPLNAAEPRSAIPWLSESIETQQEKTDNLSTKRMIGPPPPGQTSDDPRSSLASAPRDGTITVTPLGDIGVGAVGLLPPARTGFASVLWGSTHAARVEKLIRAHQPIGVPEAQALFTRILLAETKPPVGMLDGTALLIARLDRLLEMGALEEADALLARAGPNTPELFRRWFDVGLLLERADAPCAALSGNPSLSPTLPARVFCLARGGDWNAAEITLTLGENVGSIPAEQERLLARFLDPELFEEEAPPPIPNPLTGLDFLMREAVGLPRPRGPLPLAFLYHDLGERTPMRTRIAAGERLVGSSAVSPSKLFAAYRAGEPAASGGVWDRAAAIQSLDAKLADGSLDEIGSALVTADAALHSRGLRVALARNYAGALAQLDAEQLSDPSARRTLFELLLLGGKPDAARRAAGPRPDPHAMRLLALAEPSMPAPPFSGASDLMRAALSGLRRGKPDGDRQLRLANLIGSGRRGEAILGALDLLSAGTAIDPPALRDALFTLSHAGQEPSARAVALQTLLLSTDV